MNVVYMDIVDSHTHKKKLNCGTLSKKKKLLRSFNVINWIKLSINNKYYFLKFKFKTSLLKGVPTLAGFAELGYHP